jgi:XTP/dITP diphosphohydrolase
MKLIFATHNHNKAREIQAIMPEGIQLLTLDEIQCNEDIPETASTLEGNAQLKAAYIAQQFDMECFADDTGLEVEALDGEPGVHSARYAGQSRDPEANMHLLLKKLATKTDRSAQFRTVIALYWNKEYHFFEGIVTGKILQEKKGNNGFGYDPIFEPENCGKSFAEMTLEEKNKYSHRSRAFDKMIAFLGSQKVTT